ncbi:MAG: hypothetical protein L0H64_18460 [Pseudonocardia sp.]|nr:hypothetical protein [Pseudonocardia sp.]
MSELVTGMERLGYLERVADRPTGYAACTPRFAPGVPHRVADHRAGRPLGSSSP